jgi:hypothetical protein
MSTRVDIATVHAGLGNRAEALTLLEQAVGQHVMMLYLGLDLMFRSLHDEPRFQLLLKKVGLPTN